MNYGKNSVVYYPYTAFVFAFLMVKEHFAESPSK